MSGYYALIDCDHFFQLFKVQSDIEAIKNVFKQEVVSKAREMYHELYSEEVQLNERFRTFVVNYKAAYEGRNTRKDQVTDTAKGKSASDSEREFHTCTYYVRTVGPLYV